MLDLEKDKVVTNSTKAWAIHESSGNAKDL